VNYLLEIWNCACDFLKHLVHPPIVSFDLQLMLPAFSTCCEELVSKWVQSLGSDGTCEVDVCPELQRLTGDVISRTAFGSNYLEGTRIFQLQSEQAERIVATLKRNTIPGYL
jgi:cytochrome P450